MAFDKEKTLAAAQKYADKDQHEKAIREFQKILDVEPNDLRVLLLIASSYERVGKMDEASNAYVKIFEQYRNQGAYQKALAIIKQAQHCNPNSDDIAMSMAEIYSALGLPHEAVNQLEKCLANAEKIAPMPAFCRRWSESMAKTSKLAFATRKCSKEMAIPTTQNVNIR